MAEKKYIERETLLERIDDILDCADMVFEPNDHCCHDGDCEGCKWAEIKNAIRKIIADFPAADVRPVVKSKWADNHVSFYRGCPECGAFVRANLDEVFLRDFPSAVGKLNFCPNCGADMREES